MQAYEFFATPENGVISIPEQLRDKIISYVKVIVHEEKPAVNKKSDFLLPPTLDTRTFKFDREDANER